MFIFVPLGTYIKIPFGLYIENIIKTKQEKEKTKYVELVAKLDTLSPLKTLTRGYSIVEKGDKIIKSKNEILKGDIMNLRFVDGSVQVEAK